jgi:hypothetical protein
MQFTLDEVIQAEKNVAGASIRIYLKPNTSLRPVTDDEVDHNMICVSTVIDSEHNLYQTIVEKFQINIE